IQEDFKLWTIEQIRSTKEVEQIRSNTRANTLVSLEQGCSLIKETLKDKKKDRGLSTSEKKKKKEADERGLKMLKEVLKKKGKGLS
ncbi:unnamed protein product, partial [marine sediment metagenome]